MEKKSRKIIALVAMGMLLAMNMYIVVNMMVIEKEDEHTNVLAEDSQGNPTGYFSLDKRRDGKYDMDIWTDSDAKIFIKGLENRPRDLSVKFDHAVDDPAVDFIVYMDSIDMERAYVTLPRNRAVSEILYGESFDPVSFTCSEWKSTGIEFSETEGSVTFEVEHFSAYGVKEKLNTYFVTTTKDMGQGSLRQAITDANENPGLERIEFLIPRDDKNHFYYEDDGIPGHLTFDNRKTTVSSLDSNIRDMDPDYPHSWWSIQVTSPLPVITDPVIIDGYSQPGSRENSLTNGHNAVLRIELDGSKAGLPPGGIHISGGESTVRGLVIRDFSLCGIQLETMGENVIEGNYIGSDISGTIGQGNFIGINIYDSQGNTIGGESSASPNIIFGNRLLGILISGDLAKDNIVQGNYIGTESSSANLVEDNYGVWVAEDVQDNNRVQDNLNVKDKSEELIFLDTSVEDSVGLLQAILSGEDSSFNDLNSGNEVVILDVNRDGIEQITQELVNHKNVASIHILSHGSKGSITLGNTILTENNLESYEDHFATWQGYFTDDADIMLYGCNVGKGNDGLEFMEKLSELTGADIAASNNPTGSSELGGDWELEESVGVIETTIPFSTSALQSYNHILGEVIYTDTLLADYLATPKISPHARQAIVNGLREIGNALGNISTSSKVSAEFMEAVPGLLDITNLSNPYSPGIGSLLGDISLGEVFKTKIADVINGTLADNATLTDLENLLDAQHVTEGNLNISVDNVNGNIIFKSGNDYELVVNMDFVAKQNQTYKFDLGRNSDVLGIGYNSTDMPSVTLQFGFSLDLTFGCIFTLTEANYSQGNLSIDDTKLETVNSDFFIRDTTMFAHALVNESGLYFGQGNERLQIGFLEIEVENGYFSLVADVEAEFLDPDSTDPITLSELITIGNDIETYIDVPSPTGNISAHLPVNITNIPSTTFAYIFYNLTLDLTMSGDPFDEAVGPGGSDDPRTAPVVGMSSDFKEHLLPFNSLLPDGVIGLISQLQAWFGSFGASQLFSIVDVPFADGHTLANVLDFFSGIGSLIENITETDEDDVTWPDFISFQTLAQELDSAFDTMNMGDINPQYNRYKHELTFNIHINPILPPILEVPIDFNLDLGALGGIQTNVEISLNVSVDFQLTIGIDLFTKTEIKINSELTDFGLRSLINGSSGELFTPSNGRLPRDANFKLSIGSLGAVYVNVSAVNTSNNNNISDLAGDIEDAINTALSAEENISAEIHVDVILGNRLNIYTNDTVFLKIENNSADDNESAEGFELLGFWDGQLGSTFPTPLNGVLCDNATFDITIGENTTSVEVPQSITLDNANAGGHNDKFSKIGQLVNDLRDKIDDYLGNDHVEVTQVGDGFTMNLGSATEERFFRVRNPNDVALQELGMPENRIAAELTILGDRSLLIKSDPLSDYMIDHLNISEDANLTLVVDGDLVNVTVPAADAELLGFTCNQYSIGFLEACDELDNVKGNAPGQDITFKLTIENESYIIHVYNASTKNNGDIQDMIDDINASFEFAIAENGSIVDIRDKITPGQRSGRLRLNPANSSHAIRVSSIGSTQGNEELYDLADDLNAALAREKLSDGTRLNRVVVAGLIGNDTDEDGDDDEYYLTLSVPSAPKDWLNITTVWGGDLRFKATDTHVFGPRANGRLSDNAGFHLSLDNGTGPKNYKILVLKTDTDDNNEIKDLVEDINFALESRTTLDEVPVNISKEIVAGLLINRITLSATNKDSKTLKVTETNSSAHNELGLDDGVTAKARETKSRMFIRDTSLSAGVNLIVNTTDNPALSARFGFVGIDVGMINGTLEGHGDNVAVYGGVNVSIGGIKSGEITNYTLSIGSPSAVIKMEIGYESADVEIPWTITQNNTNINDVAFDLQTRINLKSELNGKVFVGIDGNRLTLTSLDGERLYLTVNNPETNPAATWLNFSTGQQTGRIYLSDLANAIADIDVLGSLVNLDISGSGNITLSEIELQLPDVIQGLANELGLSAKVSITLEDFTNISTLDVTGFEMGAIADGFDDLNFSSILSALRSVYNLLTNFSKYDFYDEPIPILGVTLNETLNFIEPFLLAIEELSSENASIVQELTNLIKEVLGLPTDGDSVILSVLKGSTILRFNITWNTTYSASLPVQIDLLNLLGISLPSSLQGLANLSGAAGLEAEFSVEVTLGMGIDLSNLTIYIYDNTEVRLEGYANASNVNFVASLGPFGLFITGGHAVFNEDGDPNNENPAFLILTAFDDPNPSTDGDRIELFNLSAYNLKANLSAGIGAILPCYFPTASNFIGNLDFDLGISINVSTSDPFDIDLHANLNSAPDFTALPDFGNFSLLDSLLLAVEGLDLLLAILETVMNSKLGEIDLPLIGGSLSDGAEFIENVRGNVIPKLRDFIENAPDKAIELVQKAIYNALGPPGLNVLILDEDWHDDGNKDYKDVQYTFPDNESELQFNLWLGGEYSWETPEIDFGLPGLGLEMDGGIEIIFTWNLLLCFGISLDDGFYFDTTPWDEFTDHLNGNETIPQVRGEDLTHVLDIQLGVELFDTLTGKLLFLQLEIENLDVTEEEPDLRSLTANFTVNVDTDGSDDRMSLSEIPSMDLEFAFGARASLDLDLTLGIVGGGKWPSLVSEFYLRWGLGSGINNDSDNPLENHYRIPWINFTNVGLNLGSFFSDFLRPIVETIQTVTEPLQPLVDILTSPIPVISDLAGEDITLIDIAGMFGVVDPAFIYALADLITFINSIPTDAGDIVIYFGSFSVGGDGTLDLREPDALKTIRDAASSTPLGDILGSDFGELLDALSEFDFEGSLGSALSGSGASQATKNFASSTTKEGGGWSFPIFEDPGQIFGLLLGRDADIIVYDMPKFTFDFTYSQFFPIWDGLGAEITGQLGVIIDLSFGFDTYGIRKFAQGGFKNPLDIFRGFYIGDLDLESGADIPEVTLYGGISGAAVLNLVVAKAGVGGGVYATVEFNLNDPDGDGKIRIEELWGNLLNGFNQLGPLGFICIFDIYGKVEARLFAFVEALWGLWEKTWYFGPSLPLIEFSYSCPKPPVLASVNEGTGDLLLHMGDFAADRLYGDTSDTSEEFHVRLKPGSSSTVEVWAPGLGVDFGDRQEYSGVKNIVAIAGDGRDIIDLKDVTTTSITADLKGDSGNDVLIAGDGAVVFYGGLGDDVLIGGLSDDELYGEKGNDLIVGNGGSDLIVGEEGNDVLNGDAQPAAGDDPWTLRGSHGVDYIYAGAGNDLMAGGGYGDVLRGDDGKDRIWGDSSIGIESAGSYTYSLMPNSGDDPHLDPAPGGQSGNDNITGDADADVIYGEGKDDWISGGGAPDYIEGGSGVDTIWGDSSFLFNKTTKFVELKNGAPFTLFPIYGTAGGDNISGNAGDDLIFGEDGNDELHGDEDNDILYGNRGSDVIYGGDDEDNLYGGTGNDRMFGNDGHDMLKGEDDNDIMFGDDGEIYLVPNQLTINLDHIITVNTVASSGDDTMHGSVGDDVMLGGPGEDTVNGSTGDDFVFGDNGELDYTFFAGMGGSLIDLVQSVNHSDGATDHLYGGEGDDFCIGGGGGDFIYGDSDAPGVDGEDILIGDNGLIDFVPDENVRKSNVTYINTTDIVVGTGGDDYIDGSENADIILGGVQNDDLIGGLDDDILIGDSGELDYDTGDGDLSTLDLIRTTDTIIPVDGGTDDISGGEGNDIALGGDEGDNIYGDDTIGETPSSPPGEDILVGDQGELVFSNGIIEIIESTDSLPADGGSDTIKGNEESDIIIGGVEGDELYGSTGDDIMIGDEGILKFNLASGAGGDDDPETLDLIQTIEPSLGGSDTIRGDENEDIILGGAEGDDIWGNDADDLILGDNGKITMPGGVIDLVETTNPSIGGSDTIEGNDDEDIILGGAAGDDIWGNESRDIILGDNGKITMPDEVIELVETTDPTIGGIDNIEGNDDDDIILGGPAGDYIWGNDDDDIILGDSGKVTMPNEIIDLIETTDPDKGGSDTIEGNNNDDIILGGAEGDDIWGNDNEDVILGDNGKITMPGEVIDLIETTDPTIGGIDTIEGNNHDDIILGGDEGDYIWGNDGADVILGDSGKITMPDEVIDLIETTDPSDGGSDTIEGNDQGDIIMGGAEGDDIWGNNGEDMILGDNGKITMPDEVIEQIETTDPAIGGVDTIEGNDANDIILGGAYGDFLYGNASEDIILGDNGKLDYVLTSVDASEPDADTLDLIIATYPNDGGIDLILGGTGNDIAFGGTDGDTIYGNEDNDLLFGDHARVERKPDMLLDLLTLPVPTFTFIAIFTAAADGGDGDLIHGNTGDDILLGQQGDDDMFGDEDDDDMIGGHNVVGGIDELDDPAGLNDIMDGGSEDDVMAGDNCIILRRYDTVSPRIRALSGETLYDEDGNADVTGTHQPNPSGARGRDTTLLDHSDNPTPDTFGNDYMAGGPHEDVMFGQLGDDFMQGDASVMEFVSATDPSVEGADDGDDYMEGNGDKDLIFGNYGQDDILGGNSELFGLTDPSLRPDDSDTIFGGAGLRIARYDTGDESDDGHAADSDYIIGDNGNIYRIVGTNGVDSGDFLTFTYDNYGNLTIIPRSIQLLDYTPGGNASDIGNDDLIHGEASDDLIHGMVGNDVLFGEGQDDDLYGQTGHDRMYGGNGQDGMLGDDGRVRTSRNGETETLYGLTKAFKEKKIKMPGPFIGAWVDIEGRLKKVADLAAFEYGGNDIMYGGLGNDWMHGGAGDDGMLGAEALIAFYNSDPIVNTTPLPYDPVTQKISFYDAENPRTKITGFFLNFEAVDANDTKIYDGKDRMFGDNGNDWLVGGTENDRMFGGLGDDVINADDNHDSQGGLNNEPDIPEFADRDFIFGGCGLDVMIFNTGGDRVFDWIGEFNSYIAPYAPFGYPETDRLISPQTVRFLMALGEACGADQDLVESDGELGLADQKDPRWKDQMGGPRDPQAGNLPGVHRDTMGGPEDDR